jgi:pyruvate dehydrogenase E2 component (dihydrolipoamide acetyltransferase)
MAAEAGIDIGSLQGTGPQGRIIRRDIEAAIEQAKAPEAPAPAAVQPVGEVQEIELSSMRRTIAKRLVQSKAPVPHFYLTVDVRMDRAWEAYRALRDENYPVSLNDVIIKATASALRRHPEINASFAGDRVKQFTRVHIGMAVAIEDGLITPVIRDADRKSLVDIAEEARELAERARARRLQPHEYTGGTFSISNLGMMGIEEFSAIINPPEAAILAVGAVREVPVVEDGEVRIGRRMKLTLSVDHRVADGAQGARFLQTLTRMLENPLLIG